MVEWNLPLLGQSLGLVIRGSYLQEDQHHLVAWELAVLVDLNSQRYVCFPISMLLELYKPIVF